MGKNLVVSATQRIFDLECGNDDYVGRKDH